MMSLYKIGFLFFSSIGQKRTRGIPILLSALRNRSAEVRRTAAELLFPLSDPGALEPLGKALEDSAPEVRSAAARALGAFNEPKAIDYLVSALADTNQKVRLSVLEALRARDWKPQTPREEALFSIAKGRSKEATVHGDAAIDPLLSALSNETPSSRRHAAAALESIRDERAIGPLLVSLGDSDISVRVSAVHALAAVGGQQVTLALGLLAHDPHPLVRLALAQSMRKNWRAGLFDYAAGMIQDKNVEIRITTTEALGFSRDPRAVEPLILAIKDSDADVRGAAVQALSRLKDSRAIEALVSALVDPESAIRNAAELTLPTIDSYWRRSEGAEKARSVLSAAMSSSDYRIRQAAMKTLEEILQEMSDAPQCQPKRGDSLPL